MSVGQFRVDDKVAVVTGAASGIGRATAVVLSDAGARLVLADRDEDNLEQTLKMVDEAIVAPTDVSKQASVGKLIDNAVSHYGRVDVMANVAGIMDAGGPITSIDEAALDRILAVNLKGVFFGVQAALRVMGEQRSGSIVNVASAAIDAAPAGLAGYSMTKAGVQILTRVAAAEGGPLGVRVNCVAPGFIVTPMTQRGARRDDGTVDDAKMEPLLDYMRKRSVLDAVGDPEDIANAILYLASDASRFMTGQVLRPNGGTAMPA